MNKKRLIIDPVTYKILGYENISEYMQLYSDDIMIDKEEGKLIGCYYEDGKVVDVTRDDYHARIEDLCRQLSETHNILNDKPNQVADAIMNGNLDQLRKKFAKAEIELSEKQELITSEEKKHADELYRFYRKAEMQKESGLKPLYLSSVCLLIKDENHYLREWIEHYLEIGFDHIYIYDNGSEKSVKNAITSWYQKESLEKITVIDYSGQHEDLQTESYNDFLVRYAYETFWVLFADSDEFVEFPKHKSVNEFLKGKEEYTTIMVDFIEYGADGRKTYDPAPVRERFLVTVTVKEGVYYKEFIQPARIDGMRTHYPIFNKDKHQTIGKDKEGVVIHHYYTKSYEEWCKKINRGSCDPNYLKNHNEFFLYNPDMDYLKTNHDCKQNYYG